MNNKLTKLVVIGGSNAYWEINELIDDINKVSPKYEVIAILDDNKELQGKVYNGITVDGPLDKANTFPDDVRFIFAIGSFGTRIIRQSILKRLNIAEERFETLVHPTVKIFSTATVKPGCIIHYGTVIFHNTYINSFCVIATNCAIAVGNIIGRGALLGSSITTTTGVKIGCFSFVGSGTNIGEYVEIGPGAKIGMGSLILKNVNHGTFVLGNPPRMLDRVEVPQDILDEWETIKVDYENSNGEI